MILLCVAIHGDNVELAQEQLADVLHDAADPQFQVYRAWVERMEQLDVHEKLDDSPREVKL